MEYCRLAIVIPSWNCKVFIAEMLDGIIAQIFQDWQLYIVDDQSTDSSLEIITKYVKQDNRIHYTVRNRKPKGAQTCRNIGYDLTEGAEYVMWLDADDKIAPYCFKQRVEYMDRHPELDFGIFPAITFQDELWEKTAWCYGYPLGEDIIQSMLQGTLPLVGWTNIFRRKTLTALNHRWDEKVMSGQDFDFNIQFIIKGARFDYAYNENAKVDYFYRTKPNPERISSKIFTKEHYDSHIYMLTKTINSLSDENKKKYQGVLEIYIYNNALMFIDSPQHYNQLMQVPWVNENRIFKLRLKIWRLFRFHLGGRFIFRYISKRKDFVNNEWKSKVNSAYKQLRLEQSSK